MTIQYQLERGEEMKAHAHSQDPENSESQPMRCGAKTRSGKPCRSWQMPNGRCRMHGGQSTGAPGNKNSIGKRNALKHGIYSRDIAELPTIHLDAIKEKIGSLDTELLIARVQLCRALAAQKKADDKLELVEKINREGPFKGVAGKERIYRRVEYAQAIDRLLGRVESLEKARAELMAKSRLPNDSIIDGMGKQDIFITPDEQIPENPVL